MTENNKAKKEQTESNKDTKEQMVPILTKIQNELKVPKNQYNKYGGFYYRNAEDIERAVKPLLLKYGAQLFFDEQPIEIGNRIYIEEIAHYKDSEQEIVVKGHAREEDSKKGMDGSQLTGSSSSYATKSALSKLFLIDDTKDADSQDNRDTNSSSYRSKARANQTYRRFTEEELRNYTVMYKSNKSSSPVEKRIAEIYYIASKGNKEAADWWKTTRTMVNTPEGQALLQFEKIVPKLKQEWETKIQGERNL